MKRAFYAFVACLTAMLAGCSSFSMISDKLVMDSLSISDSVVFTPTNMARASVACHYPVGGNPILVDSIKRWIGMCFEIDGLKYRGDESDIPRVANSLLHQVLISDSTEMADVMSNSEFVSDFFSYDYDNKIAVVYEDDNYVTFCQTLYNYMGGAHGSTYLNYTTFCKTGADTGKRMGWDLLSENNPHELKARIVEGFMQYLGTEDAEDLYGCLFIEEGEEIPFPSTPPYLTADGIKVIYQEYEIGPYALGCPEFVIGQAEK